MLPMTSPRTLFWRKSTVNLVDQIVDGNFLPHKSYFFFFDSINFIDIAISINLLLNTR